MTNIVEINCVGDFLRVIKEHTPKDKVPFYRGQRNAAHGINSSLCRLLAKEKLKKKPKTTYRAVGKK